MWTVLIISFEILHFVLSENAADKIRNERDILLKKEINMMLGNDIVLSDTEEKANEIIMKMKHKELDFGLEHAQLFNLSKHFFEYKDDVKKSNLFKMIQKMPKGAVLHAHDTGLLSPDYVVELTYWDNLYVCFFEDNLQLKFSKDTPKTTCGTKWLQMEHARYTSGDVEKFDANLRKHFTIVIDNPNGVYTDVNTVWNKFTDYFITTTPLFTYKPIWEKYFYDTLKTFREDNVMYIEIRSVLPLLYDLEGNVFDSVDTAKCYKNVLDKFLKDYPDFFGAKLIYAPLRLVDAAIVKEYIHTASVIQTELPRFLAGFDLVGQEDLGVPIKEFLTELAEAKGELDFFFHAGETNWYGSSSDENLVDVILLGARRIGHAFALIKHPLLVEEVKKRNIALEINVISNAVLRLVGDIRNHPLASFLAQDLPVVISCDDPGIWEADPLSHDFYVTFVGVASRHADLKLLKKLALNSLYYSTYTPKDKLIHEFEIRWTKFIDSIVKGQW